MLWPLRTQKQEHFNSSVVFKAKRPVKGPQTRYHAGVDVSASAGDEVLAPEDMIIIDADRGWEQTVVATLAHTASGKSILVGGLEPHTSLPAGTNVKAGQAFAKIGTYPKGSSMLHFQLYDAQISPIQANHAQSWSFGAPKPAHLIDPMDYLLKAVQGQDITPPPSPDLDDINRTPENPCVRVNGILACQLPDIEAWRGDLSRAVGLAFPTKQAMETWIAQYPGEWDAKVAADVNQALDRIEEGHHVELADTNGDYDGEGPTTRVIRLLTALQHVEEADQFLRARLAALQGHPLPAPVPAPPHPQPPAPAGGGAGAAIVIGGLTIVSAGAYFLLRRKRR